MRELSFFLTNREDAKNTKEERKEKDFKIDLDLL